MVNYAPHVVMPMSILISIALVVSIARIYYRIRPEWLIKWDDYTLLFALVLTLGWFSLDIALCVFGRGIDHYALDVSIYLPLSMAVGILWIWALNMIRISMGFMLLRLKDSAKWKWPLWALITTEALLALAATAMQLAFCWPISSKPNPHTKCISTRSFEIYGWVYSAINIASDLVLALMPLKFIWGMHRSRLEKVLLNCLMAAGLMATSASIARVVIVLGHLGPQSAKFLAINDILWGVELTIGLTAASLPCLKAPVHQMLLRLGIFHHKNAADASPESFLGHMSHGSHILRQINGIALQEHDKEHITPSPSGQTKPFGAPAHALESQNTNATLGGGNSSIKKFCKDFV